VDDTEKITRVIRDQFKALNQDRTCTHNRFFKKLDQVAADVSDLKVAQARTESLEVRLCDVEDEVDELRTLRAHLKGAVAVVASVISLVVSGAMWFIDRGRNLW
jgi:hypothetical protein